MRGSRGVKRAVLAINSRPSHATGCALLVVGRAWPSLRAALSTDWSSPWAKMFGSVSGSDWVEMELVKWWWVINDGGWLGGEGAAVMKVSSGTEMGLLEERWFCVWISDGEDSGEDSTEG